ncbi:MAG: hypothetical protein FWH54_05880 [Methanobrevibacter sp.]|nr:hypothetical protein [Methanobrevibacter sp.]
MSNEPINFLIEHQKTLSELYFEACAEKEAIKKKLNIAKLPDDTILEEYTIVDNLIKAVARVVYR